LETDRVPAQGCHGICPLDSLISLIGARAFKTILLQQQRPLSITYYILPLTNTAIVTDNKVLLYTKNYFPP